MKALMMAVVFTGFIAVWGFLVLRSDMADRDVVRGEAVAANYVIFRNAVFDHAFSVKNAGAGTVLPDNPALELPHGWSALRDWRGLLQMEGDGLLYCYVYGQSSPEEAEAVRNLLNHSMAVGWNDAGVLARNGGRPWPLPSIIPNGDVVSVIRVD